MITARLSVRTLIFTIIGLTASLLAEACLAAAPAPDLPPCETKVGPAAPALSLGIVQPYAGPDTVRYATDLALRTPAIAVCEESWQDVLPRFTPWSGHLEQGIGYLAFVIAFLVSVALLARFTPREKWRRTTLVGVLAVGSLTWVLATLLLAGFQALGGQRLIYGTVVSLRQAQQPVAEWLNVDGARELEAELAQRGLLADLATAPPVEKTAATPGEYRAFQRINLREGPGVDATRIAVLPRGERVQFDGEAQGDWWHIRAADGQIGWVSSIWLRRPEEVAPAAVGGQS